MVVVLAVKCKRTSENHNKNKCSVNNSSVSTSAGNCSTASVGRANSHGHHHHGHHGHQPHYGTAQRRPSSHSHQFNNVNGRLPHFQDEYESNGILPVGSVSHHHLGDQVESSVTSLTLGLAEVIWYQEESLKSWQVLKNIKNFALTMLIVVRQIVIFNIKKITIIFIQV